MKTFMNREKLEFPNMTKEILTMSETAAYLGVSKSYLYKLTSNKEVPHYKPTGKLIYFKKSELDEWIFKNRKSSNKETVEFLFSKIKKHKLENPKKLTRVF